MPQMSHFFRNYIVKLRFKINGKYFFKNNISRLRMTWILTNVKMTTESTIGLYMIP
jgi:uncharacterized membrane protein YjgN (DUF898 family)